MKRLYFRIAFLLLCISLLFITACGEKQEVKRKPKKSVIEFNSKIINRPDKSDLNTIKEKGQIRILVSEFTENHSALPRESLSPDYGPNLAIQYAQNSNLEPIIVYAKEVDLIPALNKGYGDIIASNLIKSPARIEKLSFSSPITYTQQHMIVPTNGRLKKIELDTPVTENLRVGVKPEDIFADTLTGLQQQHPGLIRVDIPKKHSPDQVIDDMIEGKYDSTFTDSHMMEMALSYREDFKISHTFPEKKIIAWGIRKNNPSLLASINYFIEEHKLSTDLPAQSLQDFDHILKNKQLRLITRNNSSSYFLWKNKLMGFEYELIRKFALQHDLTLKVLVANDFNQMMQWLLEGRGDIVAAGISRTEENSQLPILFSTPYNHSNEIVVQRTKEEPIDNITKLAGRSIVVARSSSYWNTANRIKSKHLAFDLLDAAENLEVEDLIAKVADKEFDLTIVDNHALAIEQSWRKDIIGTLKLTESKSHHWLVRESNPKLLDALNKFIQANHKNTFYNVTYNKYFKNSRNLFGSHIQDDVKNKKLSPYDDLIKKFSKQYGFNWLLIAAQINQESQFNPKAKSWAGARGLMQVMPKTAKKLGISELHIPKNGISAGVKYMYWIRKQMDKNLTADVQVWFSLAAYNAGIGHLQDARALATKLGLDADKWFGHTEKAMLLLAKPKYAKKARYGYVRGSEAAFYVKQIRHIYQLYQRSFNK